MPYRVVLDREALEDLKRLPKRDQTAILGAIRQWLERDPLQESRVRIRRLRGGVFPPYRLRVDPYRVLFDVDEPGQTVVVYGIGCKPDIYARLDEEGA